MKNNRFGIKKTIIMVLSVFTLALISIFGVYYYYRLAINPDYQAKIEAENMEKEEKIEETTKVVEKHSLLIDDYDIDSGESIESVFDKDLAVRKALEGSKEFSATKGEIPFTPELRASYKEAILEALYLNEFSKAIDYTREVIDNYNLKSDEYDFRPFETFLYEVLSFEDYRTMGFTEKKGILMKLNSPELILFVYLTSSFDEQYKLVTNKKSHMIFDNALYGYNLKYIGSSTSGLYSDMRIDDAYFVVPDDIDGYKISFSINGIDYILYYIKYIENNNIEIIYVENQNDLESMNFKDYFSISN